MKIKDEEVLKLPVKNVSYIISNIVCNCIEENVKVLVKERKKKNDTKTKRNI